MLFKGPLEYELPTETVATSTEQQQNIPPPVLVEEAPAVIDSPSENNKTEEIVPVTTEEVKIEDLPQSTEAKPIQEDDPKVILETIPNISAQDVPVPGEIPKLPTDPLPTLATAAVTTEEKLEAIEPVELKLPEAEKSLDDVKSKEALKIEQNIIETGEEDDEEEEDDYLDDAEEDDEEDDVEEEKVASDTQHTIPNEIVPETKTFSTPQEQIVTPTDSPVTITEEPLIVQSKKTEENPSEPELVKPIIETPEIPVPSETNNLTVESEPTAIENLDVVENVKSTEDTKMDSNLPQQPSILLGEFTKQELGLDSPPQPEIPHPVDPYFDQNPEANLSINDMEEEQLNKTEEAAATEVPTTVEPIVPQYQVFEPLPPVQQEQQEEEVIPSPPAISIEGGHGMWNSHEIPIEQRTPPIVQEHLNNDYYQYQNPPSPIEQQQAPTFNEIDNQNKINNNDNTNNFYHQPGQGHYIPPPPVVNDWHAYPTQAPVENEEVIAVGQDDQVKVQETKTEEVLNNSGHGQVEQVIPEVPTVAPVDHPETSVENVEIPLPTMGEATANIPLTTGEANHELKEDDLKTVEVEEEESGPGFFDNLLTKTKSIMASMNLSGMFKKGDEEPSTQPGAVVMGEHNEDEDEKMVEEGRK